MNENIPQTLKYSDLKVTSDGFEPAKILVANDFYYAGDSFEKNKSKYLRCRGVENNGNNGMRQHRLKSALYEPVLPAVIDFICSSVCQVPASIKAEGDNERLYYYQNLNKDVGSGSNLASLCFELLLNAIIHKRSYIAVKFPNTDITPESKKDQFDSGSLDASFSCLKADTVDKWEFDDNGQLAWARTHIQYKAKSIDSPFANYDSTIHRFTYFTKKGSYPYQIVLKWINGSCPTLLDSCTAELITNEINEYPTLNMVPIVPVKLPVHIIDRLLSLSKALFNRAASLEFNLDEQAFSQMWVRNVDDIKQIDVGETTIVNLGSEQNAEMGYAEVSAVPAKNLSDDVARLTKALYESINSAALKIAGSDQNMSRMSGVAHDKQFGRLTVLLSAYASALKDALKVALKIPIIARGDQDLNIDIDGLDTFDVEDADKELDRIIKFSTIEGIAPTAKKYALKQLSLDMVGEAPQSIKNSIVSEMAANADDSKHMNIDKTIEINGAVSQGLVQLIDSKLMTKEEARIKLGLPAEMVKTDEIPVIKQEVKPIQVS